MGNNVAADRLLRISGEHSATVDLRHNLIRDDDCDSKLVSNSLQDPQELGQVHLSCGQLASAAKIRPIQRR